METVYHNITFAIGIRYLATKILATSIDISCKTFQCIYKLVCVYICIYLSSEQDDFWKKSFFYEYLERRGKLRNAS